MPFPYAVFRTYSGKATVIAAGSLASEDDESGVFVNGVDAHNLLRGGALRVGVLTAWPPFNEGGWWLREGPKSKSDDDVDLGKKSYGIRFKVDFEDRHNRYVRRAQELLAQGNSLLLAFGVAPTYAYLNSGEWLVPEISGGHRRSARKPPSELVELLKALLDEEFRSSARSVTSQRGVTTHELDDANVARG